MLIVLSSSNSYYYYNNNYNKQQEAYVFMQSNKWLFLSNVCITKH